MQTKHISIITIAFSTFMFFIFNHYENKKDHYNLVCNNIVIVKDSKNLKFNEGIWYFKNQNYTPKESEKCTVERYKGV